MEIGILLILIIYCFLASKVRIVYLLVLLLPFHTFIKHYLHFFYEQGNMFSAWKEIAIILLLSKAGIRMPTLDGEVKRLFPLFFLIVGIYFIIAGNFSDSLAVLRDHVFPVFLFVSIISTSFDEKQIKTIILLFAISVFINCVLGILQTFYLNIPISTIMERIDFVDSAGYVQYKTNSARIMGFERMSGILGGPNEFGMYIAFVFSFLVGVLFTNYKALLSKNVIRFIYLTCTICVFCLLFSFSRAGWAVSVISIFILLKINKISIRPKYLVMLVLCLIITSFVVAFLFPKVTEILTNTFSGKEESVADRGNSFFKGFETNLSEPFGHGLGSTDLRTQGNTFFVESAFMNIAYEIGILGLVYLIVMHIVIIRTLRLKKYINKNPISSIAIGISTSTLIACFVSINPYGMPYIYFWWLILAFGFNYSFKKVNHITSQLMVNS